ncbi:hypothetical protein [Halorubrum aethiopicum]|uniref:hypothetical protein n=1 Tax=Halorubrum aethiopicum TaxID=1758255 RepID=UPI000AB433AB|nr:hypothetical protein [Halorubrum aethiopicum]
MPRKSKREIESKIEELDDGDLVDGVGVIEQHFSDKYPDPPERLVREAWAEQLRPDNDTEE